MNKEEHFDKLFTSRLRDQEAASEDWNTPSELVWENAKVHFPKPKKKKRRFFIFLFPLIGLMGALLFLFSYPTSEAVSKNESSSIQAIASNSTTTENNPTSDIKKLTESTLPTSSATNSHNIAQSSTEIHSSESSKTEKTSRGKLEISNTTTIASSHAPNTRDPEVASSTLSSSILSLSHVTSQSSSQTSGTSDDQKVLSTQELVLQSGVDDQRQLATTDERDNITEGSSKTISESSPTPTIVAKRELQKNIAIATLPMLPFVIDVSNPEMPAPNLIIVRKRVSPYFWAAGLGTSRFIQNPFLDFDEPNENTINTKYNFVQLSLSLQTGKRSSITTGVSFLNSIINVGSSFTDTYDANQPSESIASNIVESSQVGTLSIDKNESAIMINFLPDIQLSNGDLLTVESNIPLRISGYTIPIRYRRQFLLDRFTPYIMGGMSIDIFEISIDKISLEIRSNNQLIHEPVIFDPLVESQILGSLYAGFGTQYNFTDRWYGEVGVKVDLFDTKFTTVGAGIHYRF